MVSSNGDIGAQDTLSQILLKKKPECGTPKYPSLVYLKLIILTKTGHRYPKKEEIYTYKGNLN